MLSPPPEVRFSMRPPPEELPDRKHVPTARGHLYVGTRLFGKVQKAPRGQFIATRFVHVLFFPVFPLGSFLVTESHDRGWAGFEIPQNPLSVFVGYLRGLSAWAAVSALIFYLEYLENRSIESLNPLIQVLIWIWFCVAAIGILGLVFSYLSPRITKATPATEKWINEILEKVVN